MLRNLATTLSFIAWFFATGIASDAIAAGCLLNQASSSPFKNQLTSRLENEQQATRFISGAETIVRSLEEKTSLTHSMAQDVESKTKSSKSKAWVSNKSVGHNHSTFDGVQVSAGGGFQVEGAKGVELDLPTNQKKHTSRDDFLNNPLHSYANVLMDREDVTFKNIYESYKDWNDKSRGPTAGAK